MLAPLAGRIYDHAPQQNAVPLDGVTGRLAMKESAPWFVWLLLEVVGAMFVVTGIPLARRRVPPNPLYGVRFAATLENERVWYEVNATGGRHMIAIGIAYLALVNGMLLSSRVGEMTTIVVALAFCSAAAVVEVTVLYRAASRLSASESLATVPSGGEARS